VEVALFGIGKKFNSDWIFRNLDYSFKKNSSTAIIGNNGSGKSTLLKLISTFSDPTTGKIDFSNKHPEQQIGFVAPYLELIEELTLWEHLEFHFKFRKANRSFEDMLASSRLLHAKNKLVKDFSSGMKQRLKLILTFFSEDQLLLLDEPCSNLDENGIDWYQKELQRIIHTKTIIIASNQRFEYEQCIDLLEIEKYKYQSKRVG
jgi:ABC-type multidrug transport system ATPase subunit